MHFPVQALGRATAACGMALLALLPSARAVAGPGVPDTLITGHVAAGPPGRHVGITVGGVACLVVAGGITDAAAAYQVVVNGCGPGTATVTVNGLATATVFSIRPGVWINLDGKTPGNTPIPARATPTPVVASHPPATTTTPTARPATPAGKPAAMPATAASAPGGMPVPDGLVMGTIAGAHTGQLVTVALNGRVCASVAGGTTGNDGAFMLVVGNCGAGPASLLLDGSPTGITFITRPGAPVRVSGKLGTP
jgi:hypothetical protein